ncbi:hypothetical protein J7376_18585 [Paracoccus sp. R12_1]|uniref:hypothetical protein n=1 Tax=unclassified Paracoccus (in: a-proteobacteria) TaxID=2688777 RepID=UPI001ADC30BD|nr:MULTISPECIES: hypothetical protein [unclassified Paracoccus (in: a-proteobacteria)]MBO9457227.1 hypothetical protein [Paracoccus sp. R12_2]MBO9488525.1 hypothetical protein [Paracoccus sp. R12_1]
MRDILATRIDIAMHQGTASWRTSRSLLEAANLTEQSKAILAGELEICVETAFDLYIEARSVGYRPDIRRLDTAHGERWRRSSGANTESAKRVWTRALGNPFFSHIERGDVFDALTEIRNLPKYHGKRHSAAGNKGGPVEELSVPDRIRISTFLRFGRTARRVGDFLVELGLEGENPFDVCAWSTVEEACLRRQEQPLEPRAWSEAVENYLSSPIFKGDIQDAGDPLFWVPLLMRLGGLRLDEAVNLATRDLQYRDSMPVLFIDRNAKTPAARREVPVSPQLQDLGLLGLFELRRDQNEALLFPQLAADRPGTGTARFRKVFIRYCDTHGIGASALQAHDFRRALRRELIEHECADHVVRAIMGQLTPDWGVPFLASSLRRAIDGAQSEIGAGLPDIACPFR